MNHKQSIEIDNVSDEKILQIQTRLRFFKGIRHVYLVTMTSLRIYFDARLIDVPRIMLIVKNDGVDPSPRKRKKQAYSNESAPILAPINYK